MKKYLYIILASAITCTATFCSYDDSKLTEQVEDLQSRVSALESLCSSLNSQIVSIQSAVSAIEDVVYVTSISKIWNSLELIGYNITFSDGTSVSIYTGTDGTDGTDGSTPIIGVTLVDGVYYWTLNGELIYGSDGNPIRASASEGDTGTYPILKIEDGYWYISYDGGSTWEQLGTATGKEVSYISEVSYDDYYVYITLYDGTSLYVPVKQALDLTLSVPTVGISEGGESIDVTYTLSGATSSTTIKTITKDGYTAVVTATDDESGVITITAPSVFGPSEVSVIATDGDTSVMRVVSIRTGGFIYISDLSQTVYADACDLVLPIVTNVDYTVSFDEETDWMSYSETRSSRVDSLVIAVEENTTRTDRYGTVTITSADSSIVYTVLVTQEGRVATINENWSISYLGYEFSTSSKSYTHRFSVTNTDKTKYNYSIKEASVVDSRTTEGLLDLMQSELDYNVAYYDNLYYDGYYLSSRLLSNSTTLSSSSLSSSKQYYCIMAGVNDDGLLTGYYQISEKVTPDTIEIGGSEEYQKWFGMWDFTGADGTTGTIYITQNEADESYNVGFNNGSYWIDVPYNSSDGSITISTQHTDYTISFTSTSMIALVGYSYFGGSNLVVITDDGVELAQGIIASDGGTATLEALELDTSSGTGTAYSFKYAGLNPTTFEIKTTSSSWLEFVLPVTLVYSEDIY